MSPDLSLRDISPTTLEEAVQALYDWLLTEENRQKFVEVEEQGLVHHGLMMSVRNTWGLWQKGSPLATHFNETYGLGHADDMSGLIQEGLLCKIKGRPCDVDAKVESYKKHWAEAKIDPLSGQPITQS